MSRVVDDSEIISDVEIAEILLKWKLSAYEWIKILRVYTTEGKLRVFVEMLRKKDIHELAKHYELARVFGCSREKMTRAIGVLLRDKVLERVQVSRKKGPDDLMRSIWILRIAGDL
jgi:hypothetical protein